MVGPDHVDEGAGVLGHGQRRRVLDVLEQAVEQVVHREGEMLYVVVEVAVVDGVQHQRPPLVDELEPGEVHVTGLQQCTLDPWRPGGDHALQGLRVFVHRGLDPHHHVQRLLGQALLALVAQRIARARKAPALRQPLGQAGHRVDLLGQTGQLQHAPQDRDDHRPPRAVPQAGMIRVGLYCCVLSQADAPEGQAVARAPALRLPLPFGRGQPEQ